MGFREMAWTHQEDKDRDSALIRQLVSSGKISPVEGLKMTIMKNGKWGYEVPETDPVGAPEADGVPMEEVNPTPQTRMEPLYFKGDKTPKERKAPMTFNQETGKWELLSVPAGYTGIDEVNPPGQGSKGVTPEERAAHEVHKAVLKFQQDYPDQPLPAALKKTADSVLPLIGLEAEEIPGKKTKSWGKETTGPGTTFYKPKGHISDDELRTKAEEELKALGYSDEQLANEDLINSAMDQLRKQSRAKPKKKK